MNREFFPLLLIIHQFIVILNMMHVTLDDCDVIDLILLLNIFMNLVMIRPSQNMQNVLQRIRPSCDTSSTAWDGRDVFSYLVDHRDQFWLVTGETPETFHIMVQTVLPRLSSVQTCRNGILSPRNKSLLTLIWLRQYPTYSVLSILFDVSPEVICRNLEQTWVALWHHFHDSIQWPNAQEWTQRFGYWPEMPNIVGVIDGTSHEILIPQDEQQLYYSGHRQYHCFRTQIIIDNRKTICYVHSGFLGHMNDAASYRLCPRIGQGRSLDFPVNARILADSIYPNEYPLITPYKATSILNQPPLERRRRRRVNRKIRSRRVYVEHIIKEIKTFMCISSIYRHHRFYLPSLVELCASLAKRKIDFLSSL